MDDFNRTRFGQVIFRLLAFAVKKWNLEPPFWNLSMLVCSATAAKCPLKNLGFTVTLIFVGPKIVYVNVLKTDAINSIYMNWFFKSSCRACFGPFSLPHPPWNRLMLSALSCLVFKSPDRLSGTFGPLIIWFHQDNDTITINLQLDKA